MRRCFLGALPLQLVTARCSVVFTRTVPRRRAAVHRPESYPTWRVCRPLSVRPPKNWNVREFDSVNKPKAETSWTTDTAMVQRPAMR